jgi:hypothetical protein
MSWADKVEMITNAKGKFGKECRTGPYSQERECVLIARARVDSLDVTLVEHQGAQGWGPYRQWCVEERGLWRKRCEDEPQEVGDLTTTPETRKAIEEAVKAMGERKPPPLTDKELRTLQRDSCVPDGHRGRDLTIKECKREYAWTESVLKRAAKPSYRGNVGLSVTRCSDYCHERYPKLSGYYKD